MSGSCDCAAPPFTFITDARLATKTTDSDKLSNFDEKIQTLMISSACNNNNNNRDMCDENS